MNDESTRATPRCVRELAISDYHADRSALSSSILKAILRSPAHCRRYQLEGRSETPSMLTGRAIHAALLEPAVFERDYVVVPKLDRRTKTGKSQWAAFCQEHAGKTLLSVEELDFIRRLRAGIERHVRAKRLLELPGEAELSLFWTDPATGLALKARPDRVLRLPIMVELKSTSDAQRSAFARKIVEYEYHLSVAMYLDGIRTVLQQEVLPVFLVVEDGSFEVCVYRPDVHMLRLGHERFRYALHTYARCLETEHWPGYQPEAQIEELSLPNWAAQRAQPLRRAA